MVPSTVIPDAENYVVRILILIATRIYSAAALLLIGSIVTFNKQLNATRNRDD